MSTHKCNIAIYIITKIRTNGNRRKNTPIRMLTESSEEYARFTRRATVVSKGVSCRKFGT